MFFEVKRFEYTVLCRILCRFHDWTVDKPTSVRQVRNPCYVNQGSVKNDNSSLGGRGQLMPSNSTPFHAMPDIYIFLDLQQY